jgi:hypothetical protein
MGCVYKKLKSRWLRKYLGLSSNDLSIARKPEVPVVRRAFSQEGRHLTCLLWLCTGQRSLA